MILRHGVASIKRYLDGRPIRIGTGCSGSELLKPTLVRLSNLFADQFGEKLEWSHEFSCENNPSKQSWIQQHFGHVVFPDLKVLQEDEIYDVDGKLRPVPRVDGFVAGTNCETISSLNASRADHFACIGTPGTKTKTGSTAQWSLEYISMRSPAFFILENVKNLAAQDEKSGESNLVVLIRESNKRGYHVVFVEMDAKDFGAACRRPRCHGAPKASNAHEHHVTDSSLCVRLLLGCLLVLWVMGVSRPWSNHFAL